MTILHIVPSFNGLSGDTYQASFWLAVVPDADANDILELSTNITDWLQDMYDTVATQVRSTITAIEYIVYVHDLITGTDSFLFDGNWTFSGTSGTDSLPPQIAATVAASSSGSDRPGQKRMIPFTEGANQNGVVQAAALAALANFATQWIGIRPPSTNFAYTPGIVSVGAPSIFRAFTGVSYVRDVFGTVGSRKRGIGV